MPDNSLQQDNDNIRTLLDANNVFWPAGVVTYATTVSDGANELVEVTPASPLPVDGSGATQPVSAASLPLPTGASTLAEQQSQTTLLGTIDADTSALAGCVGGSELQVDIVGQTSAITVDWNGTAPPIGAGTEAAALRVTVATDSTGVLSVDDNGGSITVDGTVTANLGTVDNAVLDAIQAAVEIMDDWDESDRAAVNLIASQAGITGGAGAVAANTPRVTLASDDPAVVALQVLDNAIDGSELQVDVVSSALPSGAATAANQTTLITLLGTIDTDTGSIATSLANLPNVIGTDGAAGPSMAIAIGGTQAGGAFQEIRVSADGAVEIQQGVASNLNMTEVNSGSILTALQIMDDWDESDRAKVNIITGSAGAAGGSGTDDADVLRVTLATDVALPGGSNTLGSVALARQTSAQLTHAKVDTASSGENTLVAAVGGQVAKIYRLMLVFSGAVDIIFRDGAAGTDLTGAISLAGGGSLVLDFNSEPWYSTSSGSAFILNMSAAVQCSGSIWYVQE